MFSAENPKFNHLRYTSKLVLIARVKKPLALIAPDLDALLIKARTALRIIEKLAVTAIS